MEAIAKQFKPYQGATPRPRRRHTRGDGPRARWANPSGGDVLLAARRGNAHRAGDCVCPHGGLQLRLLVLRHRFPHQGIAHRRFAARPRSPASLPSAAGYASPAASRPSTTVSRPCATPSMRAATGSRAETNGSRPPAPVAARPNYGFPQSAPGRAARSLVSGACLRVQARDRRQSGFGSRAFLSPPATTSRLFLQPNALNARRRPDVHRHYQAASGAPAALAADAQAAQYSIAFRLRGNFFELPLLNLPS